jgi:hypothetical protein
MLDRAWAEEFAHEWIAAWNSHDLERVLSHYTDDFQMTSPLIAQWLGIANGQLQGKEAIRRYWAQGLAKMPQLQFKLLDIVVGVNSLGIVFESVGLPRTVLEFMQLDEQKRCVRSEALHGATRAPEGSSQR